MPSRRSAPRTAETTSASDDARVGTSRSTRRPEPAHVDGVLVVGGGYAGVHAARAASDDGAAVTVVDPTGDYDFVPRLAAVAGGTAPVTDASAPLAELVDQVRLGTVVGVDDGAVELADGMRLSADAVIVTAGAVPTRPPIDGIEHAWPLRTARDAFALRRAIEGATSLIVVGGGATGVQLAGAAAAAHPDLDVHLIETSDVLLDGMTGLGDHARRILADRGVDVRTATSVEAVVADGARLDDGTRIDGVVAWAAGFSARADELGVDVHTDGRILVDRELRVMGMSRTFAAGDIALHLDRARRPLPESAQIAVQAGAQAGRNAARLIAGGSPEPGSLTHRGWVLDLGGGRGVAEIGPVTIASAPLDRLAPLLHTAIDLKHLTEIGGWTAVRHFRPGASRSVASADVDEVLEELASTPLETIA